MAVYTNVRMKADSPEGQWWQHQTDRDYAMQVLVQLANHMYGENADLKKYSLEKMIQKQPSIPKQVVSLNSATVPSNPLSVPEKPEVFVSGPTHQSVQLDAKNAPQKPITTPENQTLANKESSSAETDDTLSNALFGDDNDDQPITDKSTNQKQPGSFRDKL